MESIPKKGTLWLEKETGRFLVLLDIRKRNEPGHLHYEYECVWFLQDLQGAWIRFRTPEFKETFQPGRSLVFIA